MADTGNSQVMNTFVSPTFRLASAPLEKNVIPGLGPASVKKLQALGYTQAIQIYGVYLQKGEDAFAEWLINDVGITHKTDIYIYGEQGVLVAFGVLRARNYE